MKLYEARITNFRCINDSGPFTMGQVACLVGKNESGKTSILHALAKLNSAEPSLANFDKERDYPRHMLTEFDKEQQVLETKWTLSNDDIAAVEHVLGKGSLTSKTISIFRHYTNTATWSVEVEEGKIVAWLLAHSGCDANERQQLESSTSVSELVAKAEPLKAGSKRVAIMLEQISKWRKGKPLLAAIDVLQSRMPKFLYFASYDRMNGSVSLESLRQAVANKTVGKNDTVFQDF